MKTMQVVKDRRLGIQFAMKEHSRLQQAKRIRVLNSFRQPDAIDFRNKTERLSCGWTRDVCVSELHFPRELANRLMLKQLLVRDSDFSLLRFCAYLDAANRTATETEEVVIDSHPVQVEHFSPNRSQHLFNQSAWSGKRC